MGIRSKSIVVDSINSDCFVFDLTLGDVAIQRVSTSVKITINIFGFFTKTYYYFSVVKLFIPTLSKFHNPYPISFTYILFIDYRDLIVVSAVRYKKYCNISVKLLVLI